MVKKIFDNENKDKAILNTLTTQGNLPDIRNSFNVLGEIIGKIKKNKIEANDIPDLSTYENITAYFRQLRDFIELKKSKKRSARKTYLTTFVAGLEFILDNKVYHPFFTSEIYSIGKLVQAGNVSNFVEKLTFWKKYYVYIGQAIDLVDDRFTGFIDSLAGAGASRDLAQGKIMLNILTRANDIQELMDLCPDHSARWEDSIQTGRMIISPDAQNLIPDGEGNVTIYKIVSIIEEICDQKKTITRVETLDETDDMIELQTQDNLDSDDDDDLIENDDLLDLPEDEERGVVLTQSPIDSATKKVFISAVQIKNYDSIPSDDFSEMSYDEKIATGIKLLELALGDDVSVQTLKSEHIEYNVPQIKSELHTEKML